MKGTVVWTYDDVYDYMCEIIEGWSFVDQVAADKAMSPTKNMKLFLKTVQILRASGETVLMGDYMYSPLICLRD